MQFNKIKVEDIEKINKVFKVQNFRSSDYTAASLYLWADFFGNEIAFFGDMAVAKSRGNVEGYSYPMGEGDAEKVMLEMFKMCEEKGERLIFPNAPEAVISSIEKVFDTDKVYLPDSSDYLYSVSDLSEYAGKRYHGKRGHVKNFWNAYPNAKYEDIANIDKSKFDEFFIEVEKNVDDNDALSGIAKFEIGAAKMAVAQMEQLGLRGGALMVEGSVAAMSVGEVMGDTLFVHFEKALRRYVGAGETMAQEFVRHEAKNAVYANREEDLGDEGLRRSKQSFKPIAMVNKYNVTVYGIKNKGKDF